MAFRDYFAADARDSGYTVLPAFCCCLSDGVRLGRGIRRKSFETLARPGILFPGQKSARHRKKGGGEYSGRFPETYEGLLKLKGVGDYTASAIASICYEPPSLSWMEMFIEYLPVISGWKNLSGSSGIKYFKKLARKVMDADNIRDYNQGIMEFGAVQCTPKNPNCIYCPLNDSCIALQKGKVGELPVKGKRTRVKHRYFNYLFFKDTDGKTLLKQRTGMGIWQNLWEFPLLESEHEMDGKQ